jgi:hypothetical protein
MEQNRQKKEVIQHTKLETHVKGSKSEVHPTG